MNSMKIGILGSGTVAQTLANGLIKYGHEVMLGSRSPEKLADWKNKAGTNATAGGFADTAAYGRLLILAVKGSVAQQTLKMVADGSLEGKTIIDVTNPIADDAPVNGVIKFFTNLDKSLMERLQGAYPKANFVKAFNSIGAAFMVNPDFDGVRPSMFICGNNEQSKKDVSAIVTQLGFEVEDMGKAEAARAIEPLCMLWCIPGMLKNEWSHAFKLLKK